jgi:hypothetical protein
VPARKKIVTTGRLEYRRRCANKSLNCCSENVIIISTTEIEKSYDSDQSCCSTPNLAKL